MGEGDARLDALGGRARRPATRPPSAPNGNPNDPKTSSPPPRPRRPRLCSLVAIVGRPNVGKAPSSTASSAKHLAIVEDEPGVTRDRHYADAEVRGRPTSSSTPGGFDHDAKDPVLAGVRDQVKLAVAEADVVLFVTDGSTALTDADHEALKLLRRSGRPVIYVANKADSAAKGHGRHRPLRRQRAGDRRQRPAAARWSTRAASGLPPPPALGTWSSPRRRPRRRGRPNAGKSSLINQLIGAEPGGDRVPGTTRRHRHDGDPAATGSTSSSTAGVRRKRSDVGAGGMTSVTQAIRAMERCDVVVVLVDITEGLADQDLRLVNLAIERGRAVLVGSTRSTRSTRRPSAGGGRRPRDAPLRAVDPGDEALSAKAGAHDGAALDGRPRGRPTASGRDAEVNRFFGEVVDKHPPPRRTVAPCRCGSTTSPGGDAPAALRRRDQPPEYVALILHQRWRADPASRERFGRNRPLCGRTTAPAPQHKTA